MRVPPDSVGLTSARIVRRSRFLVTKAHSLDADPQAPHPTAMDSNLIYRIAISLVPLVIAIVFHEVSHGLVARKLGDPTAAERGRLTLNPFKHVDPFGTVILPLLLAVTHAGAIFGWAN